MTGDSGEGRGRVFDLAVAADGTVLIATELGLYALRPDSLHE
jgi:hypothetical protein